MEEQTHAHENQIMFEVQIIRCESNNYLVQEHKIGSRNLRADSRREQIDVALRWLAVAVIKKHTAVEHTHDLVESSAVKRAKACVERLDQRPRIADARSFQQHVVERGRHALDVEQASERRAQLRQQIATYTAAAQRHHARMLGGPTVLVMLMLMLVLRCGQPPLVDVDARKIVDCATNFQICFLV